MRKVGIVVLWSLPWLCHAEALDVSSADTFRADPWQYLQIVPNAPSDLTIDRVHRDARRFLPLNAERGPLYIPKDQYPAWLKLELHNPTQAPINLVWEMRVQSVGRLDLYHRQNETWQLIRAGADVAFAERDVPVFANVFRFTLQPGKHSVYVHAEGRRSVHIRTTLYNEASYLVANHWQTWFSGILRGISLGLLGFTFLLFIRTRDVVYLAFSALVFCNMAYRGYYEGFAQWLLPAATAWNAVGFAVFLHFYLAAAAWFHSVYLNLVKDAPRLHVLNLALVVLFVGAGLLSFAAPAEVRTWLAPASVAAPLWFVFGAVWQWRNGYQPAITYLLALALPLSTGLLAAAGGAGLLHLDEEFRNFDRAAGSLGLVLFAIGIADRIKLLDSAKREAERDAFAAQAEAKAKSEFLAKMSHEIRTPMNGVLGMVQMLRDGPLTPTQSNYARTIHNSAQGLLHIINDLLDYSKADAGKLQLEDIPFDIRELCDDTLAIFEASANEKKLHLRCSVDERVDQWLRGDPHRLRQILINLLGNALKFTDAGSVNLRVQPGTKADELEISVSDSGIGIPLEAQQRLFRAYNQATSDTARRYGGTGLGLSICKELVELMQGEIRVHSTPGEGATFSFSAHLPATRAPEAAAAESRVFEPADPQRLKVLVVDDNPVNLQVAEAMLKKLGHDVATAAGGHAGIEVFRSECSGTDLVLMDCEMPEIDGFDTAKAIRDWERARHLPNVPIIALTGHALAEIETRMRAAGMQAHIAKPLQLKPLTAALAALHENTRLRRQKLTRGAA